MSSKSSPEGAVIGGAILESAVAALDAQPEAIVVAGPDRSVTFANCAGRRLLGVQLGTPIQKLWPAFRESECRTEQRTAEFVTADNGLLSVLLQVTAGDFVIIKVLSTYFEDQVGKNFHMQRLEALGTLAFGVAHDFNNVLTGVLGHCTYLRAVLPQDGKHSESLSAIEDGAQKAALITQQIVRFAKSGTDEPLRPVELGELTDRACGLLRGAIPAEIEFSWEVPTQPAFVMGLEAQLTQVIVNLVVNARDAIEGGGRIHVKVTEDTEKRLSTLTVEDSGEGIPEEVRVRMFEPYFSTKKDRGTGLGLTTTLAIVSRLKGTIDVRSKLGVGTTFVVGFPGVADERVIDGSVPEIDALPRGDGERILVVDDEPTVRDVMVMSLEHLGYVVQSAASGPEAIEVFRNSRERYGLVVLDMMMPGMSGEEVFSVLRQIDPTVRVLLVSGFTSDQALHSVLQRGGKDFIQKPFTVESLARKVRRCVDEA